MWFSGWMAMAWVNLSLEGVSKSSQTGAGAGRTHMASSKFFAAMAALP